MDATRRRLGVAALVAILAAVAFALLAWGVFGGAAVQLWDRELLVAIRAQASPAAVRFLASVSDLHRPRAVLVGAAAIALVLLWRHDRAGLRLLLWVVGPGAALNHLLKHSFQRPRPGEEGVWLAATDFSFPSGHVANATLLYGTVVALIFFGTTSRAPRAAAVLCAATLVLLVAASRLVLGVHYPSDVATGVLVGLGWLALCLAVLAPRMSMRP